MTKTPSPTIAARLRASFARAFAWIHSTRIERASLVEPAHAELPPGVVDRRRAIELFGGRVVNPLDYLETVDGLGLFLADSGVDVGIASAVEITRPHHPEIARTLGFEVFLPERAWWPKLAANALLHNRLRRLVGEAIEIRNAWRPTAYNEAVADSSADSDHPHSDAFDYDFKSARSRRLAEAELKRLDRANPWLALSIGHGNTTLHVGIQSPKGRREWFYKGYVP